MKESDKAIVADADCNDILNWLNIHSVSLSQGLPLSALMQKWRKAGRNEYRLGVSLKRLFEQNLVVRVHGVEPPHLRITVAGYARLIGETLPEASPPPKAMVAPPPAPAGPATPPPGLLDTGVFAQVAAQPNHSFIGNGRPVTEAGLRNEVLTIYRDMRIAAEGRLIAITLSRYWQENGLRAGDLRVGLDVLLRDGYLRQRLDGIDVFWVLTSAGESYMNAPLIHPALLELSPVISGVERRPADGELLHMTLHAWSQHHYASGTELDYRQLLEHWQRSGFDDNALLHALDWMHKKGWCAIQPAAPPRFRLTLAGADYARTHLR